MIEHIRVAVDFTWYAWVLTDPRTCVGRAATVEPPDPTTVPELVRLKYTTLAQRWTGLSTDRVVTVAADREQPHGALWDEVLRPSGVTDALTLVLRDPYGCWGYLDLWRTSGPFRREEIGLLTGLSPLLTRAVRRAVASTFATASPLPSQVRTDLFLDEDLVAVPTSALSRRAPVPEQGQDEVAPVPLAALHAGAQLLAVEAGVDDHPPSARVHLGQGRWTTVRASRAQESGIAVAVDPTEQADRAELFARANGLSRRESEVLDLLLRGGRTRDLAETMRVSQHTVQDHLKAVFTKTGTHSRLALVTRAAGRQPT